MKSETRRSKLAALLAEDDDDSIKEYIPKAALPPDEQNELNATIREAEAVILALDPKTSEYFKTANCDRCEKPFKTTYGRIRHCSLRCLVSTLHDLGVDWDYERPIEERWRPVWVTEALQQGRRRDPKSKKYIETEEQYQNRLTRLMNAYPLPLYISTEATEVLNNLDPQEWEQSLSQPEDTHENNNET